MPPKTCSAIEVPLLPLCLHQLVANPSSLLRQQGLKGDAPAAVVMSQLQLERPLSELVLQGMCSCASSELVGWFAWCMRVPSCKVCNAPSGKSEPFFLCDEAVSHACALNS